MSEDIQQQPITHGGSDYAYKICKCYVCGNVEKCTPANDFYTIGNDRTGPLHCETCFAKKAFGPKQN